MRYLRIAFSIIGSLALLFANGVIACGNAKEQHPPHGATAVCKDGSYGYSQHHIGACSKHGGVRVYLKQPRP